MEVRQNLTRRPVPRRNQFIRETVKTPTVVDARLKNTLLHIALVLCGIGFSVLAAPFIEKQMNQPVEKVIVTGDLVFLDRRELMAQIPVYQGDRLLDVNLDAIQHSLEQNPWIYSARVSRQWPGKISVVVVEQKPIAFWNDTQLLNQYGAVFSRNGKPIQNLPSLFGADGNELNVIQRYMEFSKLLAPLGMKIDRLQQNDQLAWEVQTSRGIRLQLGTTQALEKMQRFVFLYENKLQNEAREISTVDLRYNNGAAVSWVSAPDELNKG